MTAIPFPKGSAPGRRPGEHQGRLLNAYYEPHGGDDTWRRCPGFAPFADTARAGPRGFIDVNGTLYGAWLDKAVTVSAGGLATPLTGVLGGSNPVTWARNNKQPTPDVVCVAEAGAFSVTPSAVASFADPDLPQPTCVEGFNGYFCFGVGDGRLFASDLNSPAVNALSFTTCLSSAGGIVRLAAKGQLLYAFKAGSCEVFQDQGLTPFPLVRAQTLDVGLIGPWAVAGNQPGWDQPLVIVAQDGTVRLLDGYDTRAVSTPDVERAIQDVPDKTTLRAFVYVVAGHPTFVLSSPSWTWAYDLRTGEWHERASFGQSLWRAAHSVKFQGRWLVGDLLSGKLHELSEAAYTEAGAPIVMRIESGPVKAFPNRLRILSAAFDITAVADPFGPPEAQSPRAGISWSHDGAAAWSGAALSRPLGVSGDYRAMPRVNRCGISSHHGTRFRVETSAPVPVVMRGGAVEFERRA